MNHHLSQDDKARWLLGQSRPEEDAHVRNCATCTAELKEFRSAVSTFQSAMKTWSQQEMFPTLAGADDKPAWFGLAKVPAAAWALITVMAAGLFLLPAVWNSKVSPTEVAPAPESQRDDVRLMESVATHLARPLPRPMERVLVLFPDKESTSMDINKREEVR